MPRKNQVFSLLPKDVIIFLKLAVSPSKLFVSFIDHTNLQSYLGANKILNSHMMKKKIPRREHLKFEK